MSHILSRSSVRRGALLATTALAAAAYATSAIAATPANTTISNQASATFTVGADSYTTLSNIATVTVQAVNSATLAADAAATSAPGSTAYLQHILTNTGNTADTYTLSVADDGGSLTYGGSATPYIDSNGNGVVDAGEAPAGTVALAAGESVSLVIAVATPSSATAGDTIGTALTVTAASGGTVDDLTASNGADTTEGTNQGVVTVSDGAVLSVVKSQSVDTGAEEITYTIQISNVGRADATDLVIFDGLPDGTSYVSSSFSISGLTGANDIVPDDADLVAVISEAALVDPDGPGGAAATAFDFNGDADSTDATEATLGVDLNRDGDTSDTVSGVWAFDDVLPVNTTISFTFTVDYSSAGFAPGDAVENRAFVSADLGGASRELVPSSITLFTYSETYGVAIDDTGGATDNDGLVNQVQEVADAVAGGTVVFDLTVTNNGTGADVFDIAVDNASCSNGSGASFPTGTVFNFFDGAGNPLLVAQTAQISAGGSSDIEVHAILPANAGGGAFCADVNITSATDPSAAPASDDVSIQLLDLANVDLANSTITLNNGVNDDAYTIGAPTTTNTGVAAGSTTDFVLYVRNEGASSETYDLSETLPAGWSVTYRDAADTTNITTLTVASGAEESYIARVSVPAGAVADFTGSGAVDGNGDGDGDFPVVFTVTGQSLTASASDSKLDAVDVDAGAAAGEERVRLVVNGSGQIQPGGSIDFPHILSNEGTTQECFALSSSSSNSAAGFTSLILVDTTGDGVADTEFSTLANPDTLYFNDASAGTYTTVALDGSDEVCLDEGDTLEFVNRVFAPISASVGDTNESTVTASYNGGSSSQSNLDSVTVATGQVRLVKTAAIDTDCDGDLSDEGLSDATFETSKQAEPSECVIWQVIGSNDGSEQITDLVINDTVPAFTTLEAGSLEACSGEPGDASCTFAAFGSAAGSSAGSALTWDFATYVGVPGASGELNPGESVTVRFSAQVN